MCEDCGATVPGSIIIIKKIDPWIFEIICMFLIQDSSTLIDEQIILVLVNDEQIILTQYKYH